MHEIKKPFQVKEISEPVGVGDNFQIQDLWSDLPTIINNILVVAGVLVTIFLIYGGIQYIMAGGDDGKQKSAKKTISNAVIGMIVILLAYGIQNAVSTLLGL